MYRIKNIVVSNIFQSMTHHPNPYSTDCARRRFTNLQRYFIIEVSHILFESTITMKYVRESAKPSNDTDIPANIAPMGLQRRTFTRRQASCEPLFFWGGMEVGR